MKDLIADNELIDNVEGFLCIRFVEVIFPKKMKK
jgi:hypothetical protein